MHWHTTSAIKLAMAKQPPPSGVNFFMEQSFFSNFHHTLQVDLHEPQNFYFRFKVCASNCLSNSSPIRMPSLTLTKLATPFPLCSYIYCTSQVIFKVSVLERNFYIEGQKLP